MERPRGYETVEALLAKGVTIPNPLSLDIGPDVDINRISGDGVTIYPGCRIYGATTVISAGSTLGAEGPVTLSDCQLGPDVELKGGFANNAVFLAGANLGLGHHVREGCILEEEASCAHTVGLKQTILFPFVTLGSLINFCDAFMAGGTSRRDHSEIGSSYIHFNFTPDGLKATPSMFGDVARGVMLDQPPIFLGGQGGTVGPVQTGYGTVVAAGSILRDDVADDGQLVMVSGVPDKIRPFRRYVYPNLGRIVVRNLGYLGNLVALREWYRQVREPFFAAQELGEFVYEGALGALDSAIAERIKRLTALVDTVSPDDAGRIELRDRIGDLVKLIHEAPSQAPADFLDAVHSAGAGEYIATIQALPQDVRGVGTAWLASIVDSILNKARAALPHLLSAT
jgi:UDP-N-acetylglucosamine/UDP-N-acetylgalactosamine diphosphorylase